MCVHVGDGMEGGELGMGSVRRPMHAHVHTHTRARVHVHTQVEDKIRSEVPRFPSKMSELGRNFILRALEKDPLERPSIMDMLNHRWIKVGGRGERDAGACQCSWCGQGGRELVLGAVIVLCGACFCLRHMHLGVR